MITTLAQVKTLLQLTTTDATRDALISALIPLLQSKVVAYCNNDFLVYADYLSAGTIAFVSGTPATITDSGSGFVTAGLTSGCELRVFGSKRNDGTYVSATVAAGLITLATGETLIDEDADNAVTLTRVSWPPDLALPFSVLVKFYLEKSGKLVESESLPGGYSVKYKTESDLMQIFNQYRKPYR